MSFLTGKKNAPSPEPNLAGVDPSRVATHEAARPVPYVAGVNRIGLTYISEAFNVRAEAVYQDAKKVEILSGYNYYASFACLVCHGTVSAIYAIYIRDELVWEGEVTQGVDDFEEITIEDRGVARIYWGTEGQARDALLAALEADGFYHPAYRGQCHIVFVDYFVGYNQTSIDNIEVVVGRWPAPGFLAVAGQENVILDANPACIIHEWWTHKRMGMGLPQSRLALADFTSVATTLWGECFGVSPVVTSLREARALFVELLEYMDGFLQQKADGTMGIGLVRETPCASITIEFDETDMVAPLDQQPEDWDVTLNNISVTYNDRSNHFRPDAAPSESQANLQIMGGPRHKTFERRWLTRQLAAQIISNVICSRVSQPTSRLTLRIRKSRLQGLEPGGVFRVSYAPDGICHLLCRAIEVNRPRADVPEVEIVAEVDRGNLAAKFFAPPESDPPPTTDYDPEAIEHEFVLELPWSRFLEERGYWLGWVAARPNGWTTRAIVHKEKPSSAFESVGEIRRFAMRGALDADWNHPWTIDQDVGLSVTFSGVDTDLSALSSLTLNDATDDEWIMLVGDEMLSVFGATLLAPGHYRLYCIRSRFDTCREAHLAGAEVWLFPLRQMVPYEAATDPESQTYKFQPVALSGTLPLADANEVPLEVTSRGLRPWAPLSLRVNRALHPTYADGDPLVIGWFSSHESLSQPWGGANGPQPETEIDIFDADGATLLRTLHVASGNWSTSYPDEDRAADQPVADDLVLRAYHVRDGLRSVCYKEVTVVLIGTSAFGSRNQIPQMTSNTTPAGTVFSSVSLGSNWRSFDRNATTTGFIVTGAGSPSTDTLPKSVGYQFTAGKVITAYAIRAQAIDPATLAGWVSWILQGSNDGSAWTDLDTQANYTGFEAYVTAPYPLQEFSFTNVTSYTYYRINVTDISYGGIFFLQDIELYLS